MTFPLLSLNLAQNGYLAPKDYKIEIIVNVLGLGGGFTSVQLFLGRIV